MSLRLMLSGLLMLSAVGMGLVGYQAISRPLPMMTAIVPVAAPPPLTVDLLVAARGLPAGTLIKQEDFTQRAVASSAVPLGGLTNSPEARADLRGGLLRRYLEPGSNLMANDVLHPRDRGFLAAVLTPGARAISLGVDAVSGDAGLIWPGDRVDIILTQELNDAPLARRLAGETVLTDIRVVAVDQSIAQGAIAAGDDAAGRLARTVTLEVTPQQAERAAVAQRLGKVTLTIRGTDGDADTDGRSVALYGGDVSTALAGNGKTGASRMRIIEGKDIRDVTFQ